MIIKIALALLLTLIGFLIGVFYRGRLEPKASGTIYFVDETDASVSYISYDSEEAMNKAMTQRYMRLYVDVLGKENQNDSE